MHGLTQLCTLGLYQLRFGVCIESFLCALPALFIQNLSLKKAVDF